MQTNGWYKIESLVLDSNNWNHSTEETIAIQESKQITLNSFKNKITNELCAQRNCDFFITILETIQLHEKKELRFVLKCYHENVYKSNIQYKCI